MWWTGWFDEEQDGLFGDWLHVVDSIVNLVIGCLWLTRWFVRQLTVRLAGWFV